MVYVFGVSTAELDWNPHGVVAFSVGGSTRFSHNAYRQKLTCIELTSEVIPRDREAGEYISVM